MKLRPGQIVLSKTGRDKGKYFVILEKIDDDYVYISDGAMRKVDKPKKKKVKHLLATGQEISYIAEKIRQSGKVTNSEVRKCLAAFMKDKVQVQELIDQGE